MADWLSITALIIAVILLIVVVAIIIVYFFDRGLLLQGGLPYTITQGSGVNASFSPSGNNIFNSVSGMTNVTISKPSSTTVNGRLFIISNQNNASSLGVTGIQGTTVTGLPVGPTSSGFYVWNSESSVIRVA